MKLRQEGKREVATIVQKTIEASPRTLRVFLDFIVSKTSSTESEGLRPYSVEEALAFQYQCKMTKAQYVYSRQSLTAHNAKVFPSYERVTSYRKENCYPVGIQVSEKKASVALQSLLDHTASRILKPLEDVLKHVLQDQESSDHSMLLTAIVPLLLHGKDETTGKEAVLWLNQRPSSTLFCRPLELEYTKETNDKIVAHTRQLEQSIHSLIKTPLEVKDMKMQCSHKLFIVMVDGKVSSAATGTANQTCNICRATPKMMNDITTLKHRDCDSSGYKYGLSVLHAHIRFLEYMLNLAYRLDIKKGYSVYSADEKKSMAERKKNICRRIKEELGLNLDQPGKSGGNTNTGNNARRFFDYYLKVTQITGLDLDVLKNCRTVLRALSCGYSVDPDKFSAFAIETAEMLAEKYPWYYMPAAVHTVLLHGAGFMRYFSVPIGLLSEEALESRHKDLRFLRLHHSRKASRTANMEDIFKGLMSRSDPLIAFHRNPPKPKNALEREVLDLLSSPKEEDGFPCGMSSILEDYSDEEEDEDDRGL